MKVIIEKVQLSILTTVYRIFSSTDLLFNFLLAFKYYFSFFLFFIFLPTLNEIRNIEFSHIL
jgi:hypothetical protein